MKLFNPGFVGDGPQEAEQGENVVSPGDFRFRRAAEKCRRVICRKIASVFALNLTHEVGDKV